MTLEELTKEVINKLHNGEDVTLPGLGTLKVTFRQAKEGRNPRTGMPMKVPAKRGVKFVPGKAVKAALRGKP